MTAQQVIVDTLAGMFPVMVFVAMFVFVWLREDVKELESSAQTWHRRWGVENDRRREAEGRAKEAEDRSSNVVAQAVKHDPVYDHALDMVLLAKRLFRDSALKLDVEGAGKCWVIPMDEARLFVSKLDLITTTET